MNTNIKVNYNFNGITEALETDLRNLVQKNIDWKVDTYLNKVLSKEDSEVLINVRITKNKQDKYEWSFEFNLDWDKFVYHNDTPFKNVDDLVNHAFEHLKEQLSDKRNLRNRWVKNIVE